MASTAANTSETGYTKHIKFTCITDGSGDSTGASKVIRGKVTRVYVVPGASVSNNFTIKILDSLGKDILDSDANAGHTIADATLTYEWLPDKPVVSALTCTIAAGGATKTVVVDIFYEA